MSKVITVIPSRYGSTRFPGKSLAMIGGKPLVQWTYERSCLAKNVDEVVVATDDERIVDAVRSFGGEVEMTRSDHPSGSDRVAEVAAKRAADIVINVQGDEPLIDPELIDRLAASLLDEPAWDMATAACPIWDRDELIDPSVVKVVRGNQGRALYFSRSVIPFRRDVVDDAPVEGVYWRHLGIYAYREAFLRAMVAQPPCQLEELEKLEQLRALYLGAMMQVLETGPAGPGVDTPEDALKAEKALLNAGLI